MVRVGQCQPEGEYLELVTTADLHLGAQTHDPARAARHRKYILEEPDRLTWDVGDALENATKHSIGLGVFEQTLRPREQREAGREYYRPLADSGQLLGVLDSNHGQRGKDVDANAQEILAEMLDVPFLGARVVFVFHVGRFSYSVYSTHGKGGGTATAGRIKVLERLRNQNQGLDAYIVGHFHSNIIVPFTCQRYEPRKFKLVPHIQYGAIAAGFLDYEGSYAEAEGYDYPIPGQVSIRMYKDERKIEVVRLAN